MWQEQAACRGTDPPVFYPDEDDQQGQAVAVAICSRCPVRNDCLQDALRRGEEHGLWGGLTPAQRRRLRGDRTQWDYKKQRIVPDDMEHGLRCYRAYACNCRICLDAHAEESRAYRARARSRV